MEKKIPTSRKVLPTIGTYCPVRAQIAQTVSSFCLYCSGTDGHASPSHCAYARGQVSVYHHLSLPCYVTAQALVKIVLKSSTDMCKKEKSCSGPYASRNPQPLEPLESACPGASLTRGSAHRVCPSRPTGDPQGGVQARQTRQARIRGQNHAPAARWALPQGVTQDGS